MNPSRKRAWFPWLVVGLLTAHVAGMAVAVVVATGDRTFVALPDYYGKSIRWDQSQEAARKSDALGWSRTFNVSPPDSKGMRTLSVRVVDANAVAIAGLEATATVYPELAPNHVEKLSFTDNGDGSYTSSFRSGSRGPIVVELRAAKNGDVYLTRAQLFVGSGT